MTAHIWWTESDATSAEAVRVAAESAGVLIDAFDGEIDDVEVPMVLVQAHEGPWIIYPDPFTIVGWIAEQAEKDETGGISGIAGTAGMLGCSDLEPERIVGNLLNSDELFTDIYHRQAPVSTKRVRPSASILGAFASEDATGVDIELIQDILRKSTD